ncbi:MAG: fructosamine kinase family protein [Bacteroidota bacterium]
MSLPVSLVQTLEDQFSWKIHAAHPVGGGCIHHAHRIETTSGTFFLKYNQAARFDQFEVEAKGLAKLASTQEIATPEVIAKGVGGSHAYLLLRWIERAPQAPHYWTDFGTKLARLHLHTAPAFGLNHDNYIGSLPQSNTMTDNWSAFFNEQRLEPLIRMADRQGFFSENDRKRFRNLMQRMEDFFPKEKPALLHGDLWGGNILTDEKGEVVILDPAVYYGHREMELAFMTMFDHQPNSFYEAYEAIYPLEYAWQERITLCNLYPLLVHLNLFGRSYLPSIQASLRRFS